MSASTMSLGPHLHLTVWVEDPNMSASTMSNIITFFTKKNINNINITISNCTVPYQGVD